MVASMSELCERCCPYCPRDKVGVLLVGAFTLGLADLQEDLSQCGRLMGSEHTFPQWPKYLKTNKTILKTNSDSKFTLLDVDGH